MIREGSARVVKNHHAFSIFQKPKPKHVLYLVLSTFAISAAIRTKGAKGLQLELRAHICGTTSDTNRKDGGRSVEVRSGEERLRARQGTTSAQSSIIQLRSFPLQDDDQDNGHDTTKFYLLPYDCTCLALAWKPDSAFYCFMDFPCRPTTTYIHLQSFSSC